MKSDFDALVEFYKKERKYIERCIKANIKEGEFMHAHHHWQALGEIDQKLMVLHKIKDPFYDEKRRLEMTIPMFEQSLTRHPDSNPDSYRNKRLEDDKNKLQKLGRQSKKPILDDQKIDDALFAILEGIHSGFILYLNVKNNLGINFEMLEAQTLAISVSVTEVFKVDYVFDDDNLENVFLNKFRALSFALNDTGTKLICKYDMTNFKDAISIKIVLARLIYDILLTLNWITRPAWFIFKHPPNLVFQRFQ